MGSAQPLGGGVEVIGIPGVLKGFLEEVTLSWALEVSRAVCGADTGHSLGEGTVWVSGDMAGEREGEGAEQPGGCETSWQRDRAQEEL